MVKFLNKELGNDMWVHEDRVEEYKAAGHIPVAESSDTKESEVVEEEAIKETAEEETTEEETTEKNSKAEKK